MKKTLSIALALVMLVGVVGMASAQGTRSTAFQAVNLGTDNADLDINYYQSMDGTADAGKLTCTDKVTGLGPFKSVQYNQGAACGKPVSPCICDKTSWQGSVVIEATQPIAVITNIAEAAPPNVTYAAGAYDGIADATTAGEIVFPFVLHNFWGYDTDLAVQNAGGADATVYMDYYKTGTTTIQKTVGPVTIAPGASYYRNQKTEDTDLVDAANPRWSGVVVVRSTQPVAGVVNENPQAGGQILNYEGFPSGGSEVYMPFLAKGFTSGNFYTGFQIVAMEDNTKGTVKLYKKGESTVTASVDVDLSKYGSLEWNMRDRPASAYIGGTGVPDNWSGAGIIELTSGSVVVIVNQRGIAGSGTELGLTYSGFNDTMVKSNMTFPFAIKDYASAKFYTAFQVVNVGTPGAVTVNFDPLEGSGFLSYSWTSPSLATNESLECNQHYGKCNGVAVAAGMPVGWVGSVRVVGAAGVELAGICNERSDVTVGDAGLVYNGFGY